MGFAFDGDSDRMLAVDSQGRVVDGDHILYLWGQSLYEKNKLPEKINPKIQVTIAKLTMPYECSEKTREG